MKKNYIIFLLIILLNCSKKEIVLATKDVVLFSNYPTINFNGKEIVSEQLGYQTVKNNKQGRITYPALYLGSNNPDSIKDAFVLGGFDFKNINPNIKKARLIFFINYCSFTRRNVIIFIRPLKKDWDENKVNYLSFYKSVEEPNKLTELVENDEKKCKLIVFNISASIEKDYYEIPFLDAKKEVRIDITNIVKKWLKNPQTNFGILIEPMSMNDLRYITTNESKELSPTGIIEIASSEWLYWQNDFNNSIYKGKYINIKNNAFGKIKYVPRIEIYY